MKIVIDIPEEYRTLSKMSEKEKVNELSYYEKVIANGTPLPKGHGRLIDADDSIQDIIDDSQSCIFNSECERIVHDKMVDFAVDRFTEAPTIIEADKEAEKMSKFEPTTTICAFCKYLDDDIILLSYPPQAYCKYFNQPVFIHSNKCLKDINGDKE